MSEGIKLALIAMLGSEELAWAWWNSPNLAFNKLCPKDVDEQEVRRYILGYLQK